MEKTFGQKFNELRRKKNYTQEQIAEKLSVSPQAVSKWENDLAYPDITLLKGIASLLDTSIDYLLGEEKPETVLLSPENKKDVSKMMLKIKVLSDKEKISVNLPVGIIKLLLSSESKMDIGIKGDAMKDIDFNQLLSLIEQGVMGKLVDVETEEEKVEIWVE